MKRLFLSIIFGMIFMQMTARGLQTFFKEAPNQLFPTLSPNSRLDLDDYIESGMEACSKSVFADTVRLTTMSDTYIHLQLSTVSDVELLLLTHKKDTLVCFVKACMAGNKESTISFYKMPGWEQMDTRHFLTLPSVDDFLIKNNKSRMELLTALESQNLPMISATINEKDQSLHFQLQNDGGFLDIKEITLPYIKKEIIYKWNGKRFCR